MNKFRFTIQMLAIATCLFAFASVTQAQATRTWVSGVGDDVNPCSRTAPCKTFAGAISKTAKDGEISVLDPGGYGAVTITKSMTINGTHGAGYGSILAAGTNGVIVNITDVGDVRKTVRLVSLDINGASNAAVVSGIRILAATAVHVDDTRIHGFSNRGISDERSASGSLFVTDCVIRNTVQSGIAIVPGAAATVNAVISRSVVERSTSNTGIAIDARTIATLKDCFITGNVDGVFAGGSTTQMNIINCVISHNTQEGIVALAPAIVRLIDSTVTNNATSMTGQAQVSSNTNNIITGNTVNTQPTGPGLSPT